MNAAARVVLIDEGVLGHKTFAAEVRDGLAAETGQLPLTVTVAQPDRLERLFLRRPRPLGGADLFDLRWRLRWSWQARRLLEENRHSADVAVINTQAAGLLCKGPMSKVPTILALDTTVRQFMRLEYGPRTWLSPLEERLIARLERRALSNAAAAWTWTRWAAAAVRAEYDLGDLRVEAIHPGLDADWWAEAATVRVQDHEGPLRLLFVGNDVRRKGLDVLIEAAAGFGEKVRLDVVSGEQITAPAGVRVHRGLEAGTPELRALYAQADVFAFPTRADTNPWTILEAMASGLPVIATAVGAIEEIMGEAGITIGRPQAAPLAAAIAELFDPELRRRLGGRGLERIRREYNRSVQMPRVSRLLNEISGRR